METIVDRVKKIIADQLGAEVADLKPETTIVNDLGADSLDTVEIVMELEAEFDIDIPDDDFAPLSTVQQAIDYISKRVAE